MHCASCVSVLERSLKKVPGVLKATVNLATEKATINYNPAVATAEHLASAVSNVGYRAILDSVQSEEQIQAAKQKELKDLKIKVIVSLVLGGIIFWGSFPGLMNTVPAFLRNFWVQLLLATPVQFWAGMVFYKTTISALKHRTANMDVLVAIGTTVAYAYSFVVTIIPQIALRAGIEPLPYFDVASIVIGLILLG